MLKQASLKSTHKMQEAVTTLAEGWFVHLAILTSNTSFLYQPFFSLICFLQCTKDKNFPSNANTAGLPETNPVKFFKLFKITIFLAKQS